MLTQKTMRHWQYCWSRIAERAFSSEVESAFTRMEGLNEKQKAARSAFLAAERERKKVIDYGRLTAEDLEIIEAHDLAVASGHFTYDDRKLGKKVMTRLRHHLRGSCCGNACRHVRLITI